MNKKIILSIFIFLPLVLFAQQGGKGVYEFLNLTNSARTTSLGGKNVSLYGNDLNFALNNPALLNPKMGEKLVLNYTGFVAKIKYGNFAYAHTFGKAGTFSFATYFMNYGSFTKANEIGEITGTFKAAEQAISFSWGKEIFKNISAGVALKPVISTLETYKSYGIASDLGLSYHNKKNKLSAGFAIKNIGFQLKPYHDNNYEPLSYDIQLGITKKLEHAPFRVSLTAHHLYTWDMMYEKPIQLSNSIFGETQNKNKGKKLQNTLDNAMRHLVTSVEFVPLKAFQIGFSYDHQRRQEMKLVDKGGFTGFAWGFGLRLRKFNISYGHASFHVAGGSNTFSLGLNLDEFKHKSTLKSTD